jgi:hypothetical protein
MEINQLLEAYVIRHNQGVANGDWAALLELFAAQAELRFVGVEVGPYVGRAQIGAAFKSGPPSDSIVLLQVMAGGNKASAIYGWAKSPAKKAGTLVMTQAGGLIEKLTIAPARRA